MNDDLIQSFKIILQRSNSAPTAKIDIDRGKKISLIDTSIKFIEYR